MTSTDFLKALLGLPKALTTYRTPCRRTYGKNRITYQCHWFEIEGEPYSPWVRPLILGISEDECELTVSAGSDQPTRKARRMEPRYPGGQATPTPEVE